MVCESDYLLSLDKLSCEKYVEDPNCKIATNLFCSSC